MIGKLKDRLRIYFGYFLNFPQFIYKRIIIGCNIAIYGKLDLHIRKQGLTIGNDVILRSGMATNPLGGSDKLTFATCGGGILLLETMLASVIVVLGRLHQ